MMSTRMQQLPPPEFDAGIAESPPATPARRVSLEDAIGVGTGPRTERTALLVRAFETQHDVLERYYGSWIAVAVALVRDAATAARAARARLRARRAARAERRGVAVPRVRAVPPGRPDVRGRPRPRAVPAACSTA